MSREVSYSSSASKVTTLVGLVVVLGYLLLRRQFLWSQLIGDNLITLSCIAIVALSHAMRRKVTIRSPENAQERKRVGWSYVVAILGATCTIAGVALLFIESDTGGIVVGSALTVFGLAGRAVADLLYRPFVVPLVQS